MIFTDNPHVQKWFVVPTQSGTVQFFRYSFLGGFSAIVDIATLTVCTSVLHIHYLISACLGFVLGIIINYVLSMMWIFESSGKKTTELTFFIVIGLGGLGLNELIIWIMVRYVGLFYLIAKLVAVLIVLVWNFTLRRLLFSRLLA